MKPIKEHKDKRWEGHYLIKKKGKEKGIENKTARTKTYKIKESSKKQNL